MARLASLDDLRRVLPEPRPTTRAKILDAHTIQIGAPANKTITVQTILIGTGTTLQAIRVPCFSSHRHALWDTPGILYPGAN